MPTVIDALVVTFGLDPKNFNKEQKDLLRKLKKTSDQSKKTTKEVSSHGKETAEVFRGIKVELLGIIAALGAATGIKGFLRDMVGGQADLGRLSKNIGVNARQLEAWGTVAAGVGEKAASAYNAMMALTMGLGEARIRGHSALTDTALRYGINLTGSKNAQDILLRIAEKIRSMPHAEGMYAASEMGLGGMYNVLDLPEAKLKKYLSYAESLSHVTHKGVLASMRLQMQWAMLGERLRGVEESIFNAISPALERLLTDFSKWADSVDWNKVGSEIESIGASLLKWAQGFDWKGFWADFKSGVREVWQMLKELKPLMDLAAKLIPSNKHKKGAPWSPMDTSDSLGQSATNAWTALSMWAANNANNTNIAAKGSIASKVMHWLGAAGGNAPPKKVHVGSQKVTWVPLGIRNNNPLDLRYAGQAGAVADTSTDQDHPFAKFKTMHQGMLAATRQLRLYAQRGNDTIAGIVQKFAPKSDGNDVKKYIATVMKIMGRHYRGLTKDSHLNILSDPQQLALLMRAMSLAEGTSSYISNTQILGGVYGAYSYRHPIASRTTNRTETHIGKIEVHTAATDANGMARDVRGALSDHPLALTADSGVN